ncbi:MAG: NAD(P)-binding protein [Lentimonas sp.]
MKPLTIIGGGLAGLALGNALQREGVTMTLYEAGNLPRHRVCGEFICGRGATALGELDLNEALDGCALHQSTLWHIGDREVLMAQLPSPASGLSRHLLDKRLADRFQQLGGQLRLNSRFKSTNSSEGIIYCNGRKPTTSDWIGLKLHCTNLDTKADLELHLGRNGYVGLSAIENGRVNVCALVKRNPELKAPKAEWLITYLKASGLNTIAERIVDGGIDPDSHAGVAGIQFSQIPERHSTELRLGDAYSVIPPFTGNGMSIALESAAIAFPHFLDYSRGNISWGTAQQAINKRCHKHFDSRLKAARALHPWLSTSLGQKALSALSSAHLLPFNLLYKITH